MEVTSVDGGVWGFSCGQWDLETWNHQSLFGVGRATLGGILSIQLQMERAHEWGPKAEY